MVQHGVGMVTEGPAGTTLSRNDLARDHGTGFAKIARDHGTGFAKIAQNPAGTTPTLGTVVRDRTWDSRADRHEMVKWCRQHLGEHGSGAWEISTIPHGDDMLAVIRVASMDHHALVQLTWG